MLLSSLTLRNFRNVAELCLTPGPGFNLLVGRNAQGKTNLIEAIGLLSTGQSFRAHDFRDLIRWGAPNAELRATSSGAAGHSELRVVLDAGRKQHLRNGKRAAVGGSRLPTILFAPEETQLFRATPGERRRHLDVVLTQIDPAHRERVVSYERVVRQRNCILQGGALSPAAKGRQLLPWDEQLAEQGAALMLARGAGCARLNERLPLHYRAIAPEDGEAALLYLPHDAAEELAQGREAVVAALTARLPARRWDELARGVTLVGPHRDDLDARLGGIRARPHGSQGQHRSLVLALKMAEVDLVRETLKEEPILLLDDVASELDEGRNRHFFEALLAAEGQVFITAISDADVRLPGAAGLAVFDVAQGSATPRR